MHNNYDAGLRAENFFAALMNQSGIEKEFVDEWYDFLVNKKYKVEIKSCNLIVQNGKKKPNSKVGRFDFTKPENREKQYEENIWVCFIARFRDQFMLLGFTQAKKLKKARYISLHKAHKLKLLNLKQWIRKVNQW